MVRAFSIALMLLLGGGCAAVHTPLDDGYDFGDGSRLVYGGAFHLLSLRNSYCLASSQVLREQLLGTIQTLRPGYPEEGLCTDFLGVGYEG